MTVFGKYSDFYDLLYKDKDYKKEVEYIDNLIKKYKKNSKTILDLGCGTGTHDILLSQKNYLITGVDQSQEMIDIANKKSNNKLNLVKSDIRSLNLEKKFDVITSLFHVISYMTNNEDLDNFFQVCSKHLKKNGILIFDCWYGPAVLNIKPEIKIKRIVNKKLLITRTAKSTLYENKNLVNVQYNIKVKHKKNNSCASFSEEHNMRYLFLPEIKNLAKKYHFEMICAGEWLTNKPPSISSWGVYCVLRLL